MGMSSVTLLTYRATAELQVQIPLIDKYISKSRERIKLKFIILPYSYRFQEVRRKMSVTRKERDNLLSKPSLDQ